MNSSIYFGCVVAIFLFTSSVSSNAAVTSRKDGGLVCADYQSSNAKIDLGSSQGDESEEYTEAEGGHAKAQNLKEKKCNGENDVCYAVWHVDVNGTRVVEMQGCWTNKPAQATCMRNDCINSRPHNTPFYHRFCCCSGHMCNVNLTEHEIPPFGFPSISSVENYSPGAYSNSSCVTALKSERLSLIVLLISIPMIGSLIYVLLCRNTFTKTESKFVSTPVSNPKYCTDLPNVDNLKLFSMIGQGRYGTVWKGMINEQTVAVKIFPSLHKSYFLNEKDIYCLPTMDSPFFLEYFGCDERRTLDDNIEYLLVLSLAPLGCLQEWLMQNTASFDVYIKMAQSIAGGLSHLHTPMSSCRLIKPSIAHRDLNSRNILVKNDLNCCISDFGFALKTAGPQYEWRGEMTFAEHRSLNEVGTLRYMAPELLEGAVNLRDCEAALKQVDIYSLGLVLWELYSRCTEFYTAEESVPAYKQPYECEVGKMPSLEQIQILVSRQKIRPTFSNVWKRNVSAKIAKDTCEDCWDHDPDARLTALCVEERFREISSHRLQSPTIAVEFSTSLIQNTAFLRANSDAINEIREKSVTTNSSDDIREYQNQHFRKADKLSTRALSKIMGWTKIRALVNRASNIQPKQNDERSMLNEDHRFISAPTSIFQQSHVTDNNRVLMKTKHLPQIRPNYLDLVVPNKNTLVRTPDSEKSDSFRNYESTFKCPPGDSSNQQFAVINETDVPSGSVKMKRPTGLCVSKSASTMRGFQTKQSDEGQMMRQRSLEVFRDIFGVKGVERLRDPSGHIKTPGDVPKSVRKARASKTLSLYDDRMMIPSSTMSTL